jgi:hypothetical protein
VFLLYLFFFQEEQYMRKADRDRANLIAKFLVWLEKNSHRFKEQHIKRIYAEVMEYYHAFHAGDLTDEQAEKLARRIVVGVALLAIYLIGAHPHVKVAHEIMASIPFISTPETANWAMSAVSKFLGKRLQKMFRGVPTVKKSTAGLARKVSASMRATAHRMREIFRRRPRTNYSASCV